MPARIQPSTEVEVLLHDLTIQEKVSLLSGVDGWQTTEISRLGIGSIKVCFPNKRRQFHICE